MGGLGVAAVEIDKGTAVRDRYIVADRMVSRMKGLLGRRRLEHGEAMLIRPAPSTHTFFMRFSIDVVFLTRAGEVLKVSPDVKPWRARWCRGAHSVLELAAGEAATRGVVRGQKLTLI
jgi:uncharacterized membrane protein (UPF0127 family)